MSNQIISELQKEIAVIEQKFTEIVKLEEPQGMYFGLPKDTKHDKERIMVYPEDCHFSFVSERMDTYEEALGVMIEVLTKHLDKLIKKYGPSKLLWRTIPSVRRDCEFTVDKIVYQSNARGTILPEKDCLIPLEYLT